MKRNTERAAEPMPVDFELNEHDLECAILGEAGWHTRAIASATNLTESQVTYRLGRAGIKRADYRNGQSEMAHYILVQIRSRANTKKRIASANKLPDQIDDLQAQYMQRLEEHRSKAAA
jgi:hypothetical protein